MKIKKLKRVWSFALAGIMALTLGLFSTNLPTQAGTGDENNPANLKVIKTLQIAKEGITVPNVDFTFEFTPKGYNKDESPAAVAKVPGISPITIEYRNGDAFDVDSNGDTIDSITKEADNVLSISNYTSAGLYTYTVKEVTGTQLSSGVLTYSQEEYTLYVKVANGENGLYFAEVKTQLTGENTKEDNLEFTNKYTKKGNEDNQGEDSLIIQKIVDSQFGDLDKQFTFDLTVQFPSTATNNTTYTAVKHDKDGNATTTEYNVVVGGNTSISFTLANDETLVFEELPAGSYYTLTEAADSSYTPKYVVFANGVEKSANGSIGQALTASDMLVGEKVNSATYTNTLGDDVETGILVNNLPYILLIAAAILGLVAFVAVKRRREVR